MEVISDQLVVVWSLDDFIAHQIFVSGAFSTVVADMATILIHGRRKFVEVALNFPEQCRYVIETLAEVYKYDEMAKEQNMSADQRLRFHQSKSGPLMEDLETWLNDQLDQKRWNPTAA